MGLANFINRAKTLPTPPHLVAQQKPKKAKATADTPTPPKCEQETQTPKPKKVVNKVDKAPAITPTPKAKKPKSKEDAERKQVEHYIRTVQGITIFKDTDEAESLNKWRATVLKRLQEQGAVAIPSAEQFAIKAKMARKRRTRLAYEAEKATANVVLHAAVKSIIEANPGDCELTVTTVWGFTDVWTSVSVDTVEDICNKYNRGKGVASRELTQPVNAKTVRRRPK